MARYAVTLKQRRSVRLFTPYEQITVDAPALDDALAVAREWLKDHPEHQLVSIKLAEKQPRIRNKKPR